MFRSLVKTLAMRHRTTTAKIQKRLKKGTEYEVTSHLRGKVHRLKLWRLKHLVHRSWWSPRVDAVTTGAWWLKDNNDLIDRLDARACESCGDPNGPFVLHHHQRLKGEETQPWTNRSLPAAKRQTRVICDACHRRLGSTRKNKHMESRVH